MQEGKLVDCNTGFYLLFGIDSKKKSNYNIFEMIPDLDVAELASGNELQLQVHRISRCCAEESVALSLAALTAAVLRTGSACGWLLSQSDCTWPRCQLYL